MKRVLTSLDPTTLPSDLAPYLAGRIYDSSCSPEARVYYLDTGCGYYLKRAPAGSLAAEATMTAWYHSRGLSVEVVLYRTVGNEDLLLTVAGRGEDATHPVYLSDGRRLAILLGETLRALHEVPSDGCPVTNRNATYLSTVKEGYAAGRFDTSFLPPDIIPTKEMAYRTFLEASTAMKSDALLHGDYCLPNLLLLDWRPTAFLDLGNGGVGDRHIDLFWGAWTLAYNLHTEAYRDTFFDAYGRDVIDQALVRAVAAAECFG